MKKYSSSTDLKEIVQRIFLSVLIKYLVREKKSLRFPKRKLHALNVFHNNNDLFSKY